MPVVFLAMEEVIALHRDQIATYGGSEGLRDAGLLESALAMPEASFGGEYLHPTLHEMAAAYTFHLASNHPFLDGNKRVALIATIAFLGLNGYRLTCSDEEAADVVLDVAQGKLSKAEVAVFWAANSEQHDFLR